MSIIEVFFRKLSKYINYLLAPLIIVLAWLLSDLLHVELTKIIINKTINECIEVVSYYDSIEKIISVNICYIKLSAIFFAWLILRDSFKKEKKNENNRIDIML